MECLKAEGVEHVFGIPGGANLPTYDALYDAGIRHILCRHEQGAGHAAEGYAKASGKVGVALATSGPGATNLVTPIADAMMDSVPTVFVTGQVRTDLLGTDGFQEADVHGMTMPVVKHSLMIQDPRDIPRAIHEAFHIARTGRPGPVLVDIPQDLSRADAADQVGLVHRVVGRPGPVHPEHAEPLLVRRRERAKAHESARHGEAVGEAELGQFPGRVGVHHSSARVDHRPARVRERLRGQADLLRVALGRRLIARERDPVEVDRLVVDVGA